MSKDNIAQFTEKLIRFMEEKEVWKIAQENGKVEILTIKSHLDQLKDAFRNATDGKPDSNNYLIKVWDRNPGYDLFQGNYTQCCIALDQFNRSAITDYLTAHSMQIVEVKDLQGDKTIANTFLYWAKDESGKLYLVADNVEIAAQYRGEIATKIRDELAVYLKQYAKSVTGKDVPVLLGQRYNGVPTKGLKETTIKAQFIGTTEDEELYLDSLKGAVWSDISKPHKATFYVL